MYAILSQVLPNCYNDIYIYINGNENKLLVQETCPKIN